MRSIKWLFLLVCVSCVREVRNVPEIERPSGHRTSHSTCFSPEGSCDKKLIQFIRSAEKSLDIAVFDITHPQIVHEIVVASRKAKVRMIVDQVQAIGVHSLVSTLERAGVDLRFGRQRGIMHHKFAIVDAAAVETGSFNYSMGATFKNRENQVYLTDPEVVREFQTNFDLMWKKSRDR